MEVEKGNCLFCRNYNILSNIQTNNRLSKIIISLFPQDVNIESLKNAITTLSACYLCIHKLMSLDPILKNLKDGPRITANWQCLMCDTESKDHVFKIKRLQHFETISRDFSHEKRNCYICIDCMFYLETRHQIREKLIGENPSIIIRKPQSLSSTSKPKPRTAEKLESNAVRDVRSREEPSKNLFNLASIKKFKPLKSYTRVYNLSIVNNDKKFLTQVAYVKLAQNESNFSKRPASKVVNRSRRGSFHTTVESNPKKNFFKIKLKKSGRKSSRSPHTSARSKVINKSLVNEDCKPSKFQNDLIVKLTSLELKRNDIETKSLKRKLDQGEMERQNHLEESKHEKNSETQEEEVASSHDAGKIVTKPDESLGKRDIRKKRNSNSVDAKIEDQATVYDKQKELTDSEKGDNEKEAKSDKNYNSTDDSSVKKVDVNSNGDDLTDLDSTLQKHDETASNRTQRSRRPRPLSRKRNSEKINEIIDLTDSETSIIDDPANKSITKNKKPKSGPLSKTRGRSLNMDESNDTVNLTDSEGMFQKPNDPLNNSVSEKSKKNKAKPLSKKKRDSENPNEDNNRVNLVNEEANTSDAEKSSKPETIDKNKDSESTLQKTNEPTNTSASETPRKNKGKPLSKKNRTVEKVNEDTIKSSSGDRIANDKADTSVAEKSSNPDTIDKNIDSDTTLQKTDEPANNSVSERSKKNKGRPLSKKRNRDKSNENNEIVNSDDKLSESSSTDKAVNEEAEKSTKPDSNDENKDSDSTLQKTDEPANNSVSERSKKNKAKPLSKKRNRDKPNENNDTVNRDKLSESSSTDKAVNEEGEKSTKPESNNENKDSDSTLQNTDEPANISVSKRSKKNRARPLSKQKRNRDQSNENNDTVNSDKLIESSSTDKGANQEANTSDAEKSMESETTDKNKDTKQRNKTKARPLSKRKSKGDSGDKKVDNDESINSNNEDMTIMISDDETAQDTVNELVSDAQAEKPVIADLSIDEKCEPKPTKKSKKNKPGPLSKRKGKPALLQDDKVKSPESDIEDKGGKKGDQELSDDIIEKDEVTENKTEAEVSPSNEDLEAVDSDTSVMKLSKDNSNILEESDWAKIDKGSEIIVSDDKGEKQILEETDEVQQKLVLDESSEVSTVMEEDESVKKPKRNRPKPKSKKKRSLESQGVSNDDSESPRKKNSDERLDGFSDDSQSPENKKSIECRSSLTSEDLDLNNPESIENSEPLEATVSEKESSLVEDGTNEDSVDIVTADIAGESEDNESNKAKSDDEDKQDIQGDDDKQVANEGDENGQDVNKVDKEDKLDLNEGDEDKQALNEGDEDKEDVNEDEDKQDVNEYEDKQDANEDQQDVNEDEDKHDVNEDEDKHDVNEDEDKQDANEDQQDVNEDEDKHDLQKCDASLDDNEQKSNGEVENGGENIIEAIDNEELLSEEPPNTIDEDINNGEAEDADIEDTNDDNLVEVDNANDDSNDSENNLPGVNSRSANLSDKRKFDDSDGISEDSPDKKKKRVTFSDDVDAFDDVLLFEDDPS